MRECVRRPGIRLLSSALWLIAEYRILVTDHYPHSCILKHVSNAPGRRGGIERKVGAACFEDAKERDEPIQARLHEHRHRLLGAQSAGQKGVSKLIGAGVQFPVGERAVVRFRGDGLGCGRSRFGKELGNGAMAGERRRGGIPDSGEGAGFLGREQRLHSQGAVRGGGDVFQQGAISPGHADDAFCIP